MRLVTWMLLAAPAMLVAPNTAQADTIKGRWLGQDRHDYCGEIGSKVAPNGVQDIHLAISGLPARKKIVFAKINGHGSDEWRFGGKEDQFAAVLIRKPGSSTADLYFEPNHVETGRDFGIKLTFEGGEEVEFYLKGGKADPSVRMLEASLSAKWGGETRDDLTGLGPSVGPDGFRDATIALAKLSKSDRVKSIILESPTTKWAFGLNPEGHNNAELVVAEKDASQARLYFQPDAELAGKPLKLTLLYESGKGDSATIAAGKASPKSALPIAPLPKRVNLPIEARWIGQDGEDVVGRGDVHVQLIGIPRSKTVTAAILSDSVRKTWVYRSIPGIKIATEAEPLPLAYRSSTSGTEADLHFPPYRDENGNTLTLRLIFRDGDTTFVSIPAKRCDPSKRAPSRSTSEVTAHPGDDLYKLANLHGTVRLAKGDYRLTDPLVLKQPVKIVGEKGAVLTFSQDVSQPNWPAAIKFHAGETILQDFAIRFATPIRWRQDVGWGPAVIGSTDSFDTQGEGPKVHVEFVNLDIEAPPQDVKPGTWEEIPKLMRLLNVEGGKIAGNTLRGGMIEFFGGPWTIENNEHRGTLPGTSTPSVFVGHDTFDMVLRNNKAKPVGPSGKTWRFLVLTNNGQSDRVEGNTIEGVGPRDDDTIPSSNAPEIILTESYRIRFEGKPEAISPDGLVVRFPSMAWDKPKTGDIVSVVAGEGAGTFRRVAQCIAAYVVLLDEPLPKGAKEIVISPGFVDEIFEGNVIDAQGGTRAAGMVLAGNHFHTKVLKNTIQGAGDAFLFTAFPTESPGIWGLTHAPFLDVLIEGNLWEDSERGGTIGVMRNRHTKTGRGRLYLTAELLNNTIVWSDGFLAKHRAGASSPPLTGLTLGFDPKVDSFESRISESGTTLKGGEPSAKPLRIHSATLNGKPIKNETSALKPKGVDSAERPRASSPNRK